MERAGLFSGSIVRLLARWRSTRTEHRAIARGIFVVAGFALIARFLGAAKEIAVAWRYGVGAEVDAYLLVFNLVSWPVGIASSVLPVVVLPLLTRMRGENPAGVRRFMAESLGLTIAVGAAVSLVTLLVLPPMVAGAWFGLPSATATMAAEIAPKLAWYPIAGMLAALYAVWIMSDGRHANTLLDGLPAVGLMVAVLIGGGLEALVWGTGAGAAMQLLGSIAAQRLDSRRISPRFAFTSPVWAPFRRGFGVMLLGQTVFGLTTIVDQFFAARLPEGTISALGYSGRMLSLFTVLLATSVGRATLPVFSAAGLDSHDALWPVARRWTLLVGIGGIVVAVLGWLLAPVMVGLLFERGTFDHSDTNAVALVFRYSILQLPFYGASLVLVSLHSSQERYRLLLASGVLGLAVKTLATFALLPSFGISGLMLASTAMYAANLILFLWAAR